MKFPRNSRNPSFDKSPALGSIHKQEYGIRRDDGTHLHACRTIHVIHILNVGWNMCALDGKSRCGSIYRKIEGNYFSNTLRKIQ